MISFIATVWCDGLPEGGEYGGHPSARWHADACPMWVGQEDTVPLALRLARAAGWHLPRDHRHYSPQCWAALHPTAVTPSSVRATGHGTL